MDALLRPDQCIECSAPLPDDRVWWCEQCSVRVKRVLHMLRRLSGQSEK